MSSSNWPLPKLIAHRGGGIIAPENTLFAVETGKLFGFRAVEFDVMLSKDNLPILMHDEELLRTVSNSEHIGKLVDQVNFEELIKIDAGSWFDFSKRGTLKPSETMITIPSFDTILQYCTANNIYMNIEIKPVVNHELDTGRVVSELTTKYFPSQITNDESNSNSIKPLFSSFSFESLLTAKQFAPHIPRGFLIESLALTPDWKEKLRQLDAIALHLDHTHLTLDDTLLIKQAGYFIMCYTVNDVNRANQLFEWGVDAICTDMLDIFSTWNENNI
eukprot:gene11512-15422_t